MRIGKVIGQSILTGPDGTQATEVATCCHCQAIIEMVAGSGKRRGWCIRCSGITCGSPGCDACLPFERQLDNLEHGLPETYIPATISVPRRAA